MTFRQNITNFLKDKESASLQDIYKGLNADGIAKHNIRAVLNISVKNNGDFKRINKGVYKLNKEVNGEIVKTCISQAPELTCDITGLETDQHLWFTVVAENTVGESQPSDQLDRTT